MNAQNSVERIVQPIVALDVGTLAEVDDIVAQLGDRCAFYKVGLELFSAVGPDVVRSLRQRNKSVFVDLKLHDIPNTVRGAARSVARLGASLLTVHASGGGEMVAAAVQGAREGSLEAGPHAGTCSILGVTVLTSMNADTLATAWGRAGVDVQAEVLRLAGIVQSAGGAGIVCSGLEAAAVREKFGDRLALLVPGIRFSGASIDDQQRVMTPAAARGAGATWIVLGRAVTGAPDPAVAMERALAELAQG